MVNGSGTSKRHVGGANSSSRRGEDRSSAKKYGTRTSTGTLKPKKYELESEGDDDFVDNAADNRRHGPPIKREHADNNHHVDNNSRHVPSPRKRVRHHQSDDSDEDEDNDSTQSGAAMRAKKARHDGERSQQQQMPTSFGRELRHTTTTTGRSPPDEVVRHVAPSRPQHTASVLRNGGTHSSDHRSTRPGRVNNTHDETDEDEEESTDEDATEEEGETTEEDASDDEELKRKVRNGGASARQKAPARSDGGEGRARATRNQGRRTIVYREDHSDDDDEDGAISRSRVRKPSGHVFH